MTDLPTPAAPDRLANAIQQTGSVVCVGLDPRLASLPPAIRSSIDNANPSSIAAGYERFCREIIDQVAGRVACVKPQSAFFESIGPAGVQALASVISHAKDAGLEVIVDAKRGDIGSTATAYAAAYLGANSAFGGDWLTVSPYLGSDSIQPFVDACRDQQGGIFVLVKTSNPGSGDFQDRDMEGMPLYRQVADRIVKFNQAASTTANQSSFGFVGAVVGATYREQLAELREAMPGVFFLIPGFGAQGGGADDVAPGFLAGGTGAIVNSSRHIIFAHAREEFKAQFKDQDWVLAVRAATDQMNEQLSVVGSA